MEEDLLAGTDKGCNHNSKSLLQLVINLLEDIVGYPDLDTNLEWYV
jgi:hypothetical protein